MGYCHLNNITKLGGGGKHYYGQRHFSSINPLARTTGASFCHLATEKKTQCKPFKGFVLREWPKVTTVEEKIKLKSPYLDNKFQDVAKT